MLRVKGFPTRMMGCGIARRGRIGDVRGYCSQIWKRSEAGMTSAPAQVSFGGRRERSRARAGGSRGLLACFKKLRLAIGQVAVSSKR